MSERNQVQELTDALTSLRVDLNKVAQQIDAKAATPAQLAELAKAIKAADAAGIAASVERAGELAGQSIERKVERRINAAATDLRTASARLPALENTLSETTAALAAAITETNKAGEWLNLRAALVLALAVVLVVVGSVASLGWQEQQTANLKAQAAALTVQIAQEGPVSRSAPEWPQFGTSDEHSLRN